MDWINLSSNACIVFTIAMFSTGIPQCVQMVRKKTTQNIPFLPYLMTNFNNLAWILYSTLQNNSTIFIVNLIGSILQTIYMIVFFIYCPTRLKEIQQTAAATLSLCICWFYVSQYEVDVSISINVMGMICTVVTILMFLSPLAELKTVAEKKSTESLSFPLTVATLMCGALWTIFGVAINDKFIIIPNSVGILTSLVRFYVFAKYNKHQGRSLEIL